MGCDSPGATHHAACDRWEAAMSAEIARLTRERDEAREALADAGTLMDRTIAMSYCTSAEMPEKDHTHALPSAMLRVIRERDEARERAAGLSRELLDAMQARDSYRASADLRVGMRREFEALLGCGDTMGDVAFAAGLARLRELLAAESRAARLLTVIKEIESKTGHFGEAPPPPEWMPMLSLIAWVGKTARATLAEVGE